MEGGAERGGAADLPVPRRRAGCTGRAAAWVRAWGVGVTPHLSVEQNAVMYTFNEQASTIFGHHQQGMRRLSGDMRTMLLFASAILFFD